jgi:hypothetical protein
MYCTVVSALKPSDSDLLLYTMNKQRCNGINRKSKNYRGLQWLNLVVFTGLDKSGTKDSLVQNQL